MTIKKDENIEKLKKQFKESSDDEKFDKNYIESLQKSDSKEAHKTIRQYQVLITIIKVIAKLTFAYNFKNLLDFLKMSGLSTILNFFA